MLDCWLLLGGRRQAGDVSLIGSNQSHRDWQSIAISTTKHTPQLTAQSVSANTYTPQHSNDSIQAIQLTMTSRRRSFNSSNSSLPLVVDHTRTRSISLRTLVCLSDHARRYLTLPAALNDSLE